MKGLPQGEPGFSDGQSAMKIFRLKMATVGEFANHILEGCSARRKEADNWVVSSMGASDYWHK